MQLLRVTKELHEVVKTGQGIERQEKEVKNLERRITSERDNHQRKLEQKERALNTLKSQLKQKKSENNKLKSQIAELQVSVHERRKVSEIKSVQNAESGMLYVAYRESDL